MTLPEVAKIAVRDFELAGPPHDVEGLSGYAYLSALVRLHGVPIGYLHAPVEAGVVKGKRLREATLEQHSWTLLRILVERLLSRPDPGVNVVEDLARLEPAAYPNTWPTVTVAVCTRDRPDDLQRCLAAMLELDYPALDLLVIDNAPSTDSSERLVRSNYPTVRYVREPAPGLNRARNRAIQEAKGDIIAYTDDDVVVDRKWVRALAAVFAEHPNVMAVTGLVVPYQLETESQIHFERQGGFGRGFIRRWHGVNSPAGELTATNNAGTGKFGTGANMAYRRAVFERIGLFDPALDVGTATNGGGDLEMFFRVLKGGFLLVYEPSAMVRHRHRLEYSSLRTQIANNGVGYYSYIVRSWLHFPNERMALTRSGLWWLLSWSSQRFISGLIRSLPVQRDLAAAEFLGSFSGMRAYQRVRAKPDQRLSAAKRGDRITHPRVPDAPRPHAVAVRVMDLSTLRPLEDVTSYPAVRVFVTWRGRMLGHADISNLYCPVSLPWLRDILARDLWQPIIEVLTGLEGVEAQRAALVGFVSNRFKPASGSVSSSEPAEVPDDVSVSVVVATLDRPDDLRRCLTSLFEQQSNRPIEVVVVDNHPASGLTAPVVAEFPMARLLREPRRGLSYARNRGILNCCGTIILTTDDDVQAPPDWLERLVAPFARSDVLAVTGNTLPIELETVPQQLFERYGGLGRGYRAFEAGNEWLRSFGWRAAPTWRLGATANAAFRASLFREPSIGLLDDVLGPGTPTGVGEDTYLFYRILKADHTIVYEPSAVVWHRHRREFAALRSQIFGYSKGHVCYLLHTLIKDGDERALGRLFAGLPAWRVRQLARVLLKELRGKNDYPLSLCLLEIAGNLCGPPGLLRSYLRVRRLGRSQPESAERFPVTRSSRVVTAAE